MRNFVQPIKTFRDPVYGNVVFPHLELLPLLDHPVVQRLRRIRQLGMCLSTFYGAEHSRFQHIVGVTHLMASILDLWEQQGYLELELPTRKAALCAALLHDVGHGPFSHALEFVFQSLNHESIGYQIIETILKPCLESCGVRTDEVLAILQNRHHLQVLHELISGQIDVDRMDYLQRDSLYTGVKYGLFDVDRILYALVPFSRSNQILLAIRSKAVESVEEFLFSRYFMHWQVYLHKTVRGSEALLRSLLQRAKDLDKMGTRPQTPHSVAAVLFEEFNLNHFIEVDDFDMMHTFKQWSRSSDAILQDLAERFLSRRLLKAKPFPGETVWQQWQEKIISQYPEEASYYLCCDRLEHSPYKVYRPDSSSPIRVLNQSQQGWVELSEATPSNAIRSLVTPGDRGFVFYPEQWGDELQ